MAVITESKPIAHELRDIARWFIHRATSEAEPETKQSHTNDALVCNKAADEIEHLRARVAALETRLRSLLEGEAVAWMGVNNRTGAPELCAHKPSPSVVRDFDMRPLYAAPRPVDVDAISDAQSE